MSNLSRRRVLALDRPDTRRAPNTDDVRARLTMASITSFWVAATPSARSDVTGRSGIPHGTMWENIARSASTLSAKPCIVRPRETRTPTAQILRGTSPSGSTQTPGYPASRPTAGSPRSPSASMTRSSMPCTYAGIAPGPRSTEMTG